MKYIKPHLSPELRAKITPQGKRDKRLTAAGVFFLLVSTVLAINLFPKNNDPLAYNDRLDSVGRQTENQAEVFPEKQVLGAATQAEQPASQAPTASGEFTTYIVKSGDTLFNISQQYNVKWDLIAEFNNLSEPYLLHAGQELKVPQATTSAVPNKIYTIAQGDTLASIAKKYNITVDDIIAVNPNLQKSDLITVGQVIKLP